MKRILIAGTSSDCGKTTITCAVLSALCVKGLAVASFKCGPDYIDPMFHREVADIDAHNLDAFFCDEETLNMLLKTRGGRDISVIEGAMGYYDGIGCTEAASAYEVARKTKTPVILVVDARKCGNSVGAEIFGFKNYVKDSMIRGVIFNGITERRYEGLAELAKSCGVTPLGFIPYNAGFSVPDRHLGLVTAAEISDMRARLKRLGDAALETIDIEKLLEIAAQAEKLPDVEILAKTEPKVTIAVSRDKAFCFLYEENLELLRHLGANIEFFSPLQDKKLPESASALYLCGGYPELYLEELSENKSILEEIKLAAENKMPIIAECGGFMLLHERIGYYPMAGVIKGKSFMTKRLQRFGYATITAKSDNMLCDKGGQIKVHEFHYGESDNLGCDFVSKRVGNGDLQDCIHANEDFYAGFPHLYFLSQPEMAKRFVERAVCYAKSNHGAGDNV